MKEFTVSTVETKTISVGDGYYKNKQDIICVAGDLVHVITFLSNINTVWYNSGNSYSKDMAGIEIISEQEWKDAVANLVSTIYLSLPIEVANDTN